jgi:hypothetical protein
MQPQSGANPLTVKLSREREYYNQIVVLEQAKGAKEIFSLCLRRWPNVTPALSGRTKKWISGAYRSTILRKSTGSYCFETGRKKVFSRIIFTFFPKATDNKGIPSDTGSD